MKILNSQGLTVEMINKFTELSLFIKNLDIDNKILFIETLHDTADAALRAQDNIFTSGENIKDKSIIEKAWYIKYPFGSTAGETMSLEEAKKIIDSRGK